MKAVNGEIKVSVIIPVYKPGVFLKECLTSICAQTLHDIEIICVDDGSTDQSLLYLENELADERITIVRQENAGGGAARNHGLRYATGKYCVFLDADDFFEPTLLEKLYDSCERTQADVSVCQVNFFLNRSGQTVYEPSGMQVAYLPQQEVFSWKDFPDYIFCSFQNWTWNKMFKREFIEAHDIQFQEVRRTNDLLFTCKALVCAGRITTVTEPLVNYRVEIDTNCQSTNKEFPFDFYRAFLALKEYLETQGIYEAVKRSFCNHALIGCIGNLTTLEWNAQHEALYNMLKSEGFEALGITDHEDEYFLDFPSPRYPTYPILRSILKHTYAEYLYERIEAEHARQLELLSERDRCAAHNEELTRHSEALSGQIEELHKREEVLNEENRECREELEAVTHSFSFRAGKLVTKPFRVLYRLVRREG
ncbi:MAG: glycosyltransferase family 2 protein [Lachnospiraceae bacterium]